MSEQGKWLPVLKPEGWTGADQAVCHPLLKDFVGKLPHMPWIVLAKDFAAQVIYPPREEFGEDYDFGAVGNVAMSNLVARPARWDVVRREGNRPEGRPLIVAFSDDLFSAERILDPGFLGKAHLELNAPLLAVAVPRRGLLLAQAADPALLPTFIAWVNDLFYSERGHPITPLVFSVQDGKVTGVLRDPDAERMGMNSALDRDGPKATRPDATRDEGFLKLAGYKASDKALVFTCFVPEGEQLQGWEVERLVNIADEGAFKGKPVERIRVTFPSEAMARKQGEMLVFVGIEVSFMDEEGGFQKLG